MKELVQLCKAKDVILIEQQDRLRTFQACLQSVVQRAKSTIQSSGNAELLVASSEIISTLGAMESQSPVLEPQADCMSEFTADSALLLDVLNNTGNVSDKVTCASTTTAAGSGLHLARVGVEASFTITAHDARGRRRDSGGDPFAVELNTENKERKVNVNLKDKGNGTYLATYTIPADVKEYLTLSVLLRGAHITDSPFLVRVEDPLGVPQVTSPDAKVPADCTPHEKSKNRLVAPLFFPGANGGGNKMETGNKDGDPLARSPDKFNWFACFEKQAEIPPPIGRVRCYACGRKANSMNYYLNSEDWNWNRPNNGLRVNGYSALCNPKCMGYSYQDHWKFVRGPC